MAWRLLQRWVAPIVLAALLMVIASLMQARAQGTDDLDALNKQVVTLYSQGKYAEATEIAKRSLALAEKKLGPDHHTVGTSLTQPRRAVPRPGPLPRGRAAAPFVVVGKGAAAK
jgi:Tetratricopeptide repeat